MSTTETAPISPPTVAWPGPATFNAATGAVDLGPLLDSDGVATWQLYTPGRMLGGYLQGSTNSGRTRLLEQLLMACAASTSHPTAVWFGRGHNGDNSPLSTHVTRTATSQADVHDMLTAAIDVMRANSATNRATGQVGFTPTDQRPGLLVVLTEPQVLLARHEDPRLAEAIQRAMATIAREGIRVGVALILASQSPTRNAFGVAGSLADVLRSSLLGGNGVMLRDTARTALHVAGVNAATLPAVPGAGLLLTPDGPVRFRSYHLTDRMRRTGPAGISWRPLPVAAPAT